MTGGPFIVHEAKPGDALPVLSDGMKAAMTSLGVPGQGLDDALRSVLVERFQQTSQWGGAAHDDLHAPAEWVDFLLKQLALAEAPAIARDRQGLRRRLVRIAALSLAAIEAFDRYDALGKVEVDS